VTVGDAAKAESWFDFLGAKHLVPSICGRDDSGIGVTEASSGTIDFAG
jgi:hypothetical protein